MKRRHFLRRSGALYAGICLPASLFSFPLAAAGHSRQNVLQIARFGAARLKPEWWGRLTLNLLDPAALRKLEEQEATYHRQGFQRDGQGWYFYQEGRNFFLPYLKKDPIAGREETLIAFWGQNEAGGFEPLVTLDHYQAGALADWADACGQDKPGKWLPVCSGSDPQEGRNTPARYLSHGYPAAAGTVAIITRVSTDGVVSEISLENKGVLFRKNWI